MVLASAVDSEGRDAHEERSRTRPPTRPPSWFFAVFARCCFIFLLSGLLVVQITGVGGNFSPLSSEKQGEPCLLRAGCFRDVL